MGDPQVMTRTSIVGLIVAAGIMVGSPLALDRLGGTATQPGPPTPTVAEPVPPEADDSSEHEEGADPADDRPESERRIVPDVVPPRGSLIEPAVPVPAKPADAPYGTLGEVGGVPVRWDGCTPIRYVVRRQAGPPNGFEMVQEALQRTSDASGLRFQFEGFTDLLKDDWFGGPGAAGIAEVWIGWAFDDEVPALGPESDLHIGLGGSGWRSDSPRAINGAVVLRADTKLEHEFGAGATYGNLLLHEIGHLVGLDHSDSTKDIMYDTLVPDAPGTWGPGDLAGLYALGSSQPCF